MNVARRRNSLVEGGINSTVYAVETSMKYAQNKRKH